VPVHEFAQHPTSGDIVAATHGRSLWVLDVTPLRQMTGEAMKIKTHLFQPNTVVRWKMEEGRDGWFSESVRRFVGQNPPRGAVLYYSLEKKAGKLSLKVTDYQGKTVTQLQVKNEPGLHKVEWNLSAGRGRGPMAGNRGGRRQSAEAEPAGESKESEANTGDTQSEAKATPSAGGETKEQKPAESKPNKSAGPPSATDTKPTPREAATAAKKEAAPGEEEEEGPPAEMAAFFGFRGPQKVEPGMYRAVLTVDGKEYSQWFRVEPDLSQTSSIITSGRGRER
jgi:hypothetical protein